MTDNKEFKDVHINDETQDLARALFLRLITMDEIDTVQEVEALMVDTIDLAVEFELKLRNKLITKRWIEDLGSWEDVI